MMPDYVHRAAVYPFYNKIAHSFARFKDLLPFQMVYGLDFDFNVGKDAGDVLGIGKTGIQITDDLDAVLRDVDTLILVSDDGKTVWWEQKNASLNMNEKFWRVVKAAIQNRKNIYSLQVNIMQRLNEDEVGFVKENNIIIDYPSYDPEDYYQTLRNGKDMWDCSGNLPVIGVFGTSSNQGKWTTQLALRRGLLNKGLKVAHLGTEPSAFLFGCPEMYDKIPGEVGSRVYLLRYMIDKLSKCDYDCIITGGQSGIVPFRLNVDSPVFTLPSINLLFGANPDIYFLVVNHTDPLRHICDCIQGLECLGKKKVGALILPARKAAGRDEWGDMLYVHVGREEIHIKKEQLADAFGLPVLDITDEEDMERLISIAEGIVVNHSQFLKKRGDNSESSHCG